jgi:hypothetical protein
MSTPRTLPALALLTALLVTPALARPTRPSHEGRPARVEASSPSFLGDFWHLLVRLWGESGVSIDPNGAPTPTGDSGPSIDPWGNPTPPTGDSGGSLDPWG